MLIVISPPWVNSAVIEVPDGCMPGLKSPTMWWALIQGYQQFKIWLTTDPLDHGSFKITFSEMQIRTLVVDTIMHDSIRIRAAYNGNTWPIHSSCNGTSTYFPFLWWPKSSPVPAHPALAQVGILLQNISMTQIINLDLDVDYLPLSHPQNICMHTVWSAGLHY